MRLLFRLYIKSAIALKIITLHVSQNELQWWVNLEFFIQFIHHQYVSCPTHPSTDGFILMMVSTTGRGDESHLRTSLKSEGNFSSRRPNFLMTFFSISPIFFRFFSAISSLDRISLAPRILSFLPRKIMSLSLMLLKHPFLEKTSSHQRIRDCPNILNGVRRW